jgi:hypothetical protein
MRYKAELTQAVRAFLNGLHEDDKQAVRVLLNAIGEAPELGDPVQTLDNVFYQKTYWLDRQRWPDGIRLFYRYWNDTLLVAVIDAGDHRTSARFPGQSIFLTSVKRIGVAWYVTIVLGGRDANCDFHRSSAYCRSNPQLLRA